jgi:hypothetical protein
MTDFFKAGGTLHPHALSYIKRPADDELFAQAAAGRFCYVLTSRQRGKSSLMIRTSERLRETGTRTALIDLSGLGTQVTREQWYLGIISRLTHDLCLSVDARRWWHERAALGPVQCFTDFLHDVVLAEIAGAVVIFIDEIDSTLKLDFTDDFFAAIRVMYNLRASNPEYDRLTFVLLGVATPADLIKDRNRTPFNIGYAIELQDFSREDTRPLQQAMEQLYPGQGQRILDRVFYWAKGHPYLTQKLCLTIAETPGDYGQDEQIDRVVERTFFSKEARTEDNLQFVRGSIMANPERDELVRLYRRVYGGEVVVEDERSAIQNRLKLIGLVHAERGILKVHNEIYRRIFDLAWIKEHMLASRQRRVTLAAVIVVIIALVGALGIVWQQRERDIDNQVALSASRFRESNDADVKMVYLARICDLQSATVAQDLFFKQAVSEQLRLFNEVKAKEAGDNLITVVRCLYPSVSAHYGASEQGTALIQAMSCSLQRSGHAETRQLRRRIGYDGACPVVRTRQPGWSARADGEAPRPLKGVWTAL